MIIKIKEQEKKVKNYETVAELMEKENISPEVYIVKRGKQILLEEEKLNPDDKLEFIKVVSGG